MVKTISISDDLYAQLQSLARPFEDREPQDVIRRLLSVTTPMKTGLEDQNETLKVTRAPRERGAVIELDGKKISATTVPDLCTKVLEFIDSSELWEEFEKLAPYKTSNKRYLYAKVAKHPQGNDFYVPLKYKNIYMEVHKNYETTIKQLSRLMSQLGVKFKYLNYV